MFKKRVYETNHRNVEKLLLGKINVQITIRFLLLDAFKDSDPELTAAMRDTFDDCPTLLDAALSRTDRVDLDDLREDDDQCDLGNSAGVSHKRPALIGRVARAELRHAIHPANEDHPLPVRREDMQRAFRTLLREAYVADYGQPEIFHLAPSRCSGRTSWPSLTGTCPLLLVELMRRNIVLT
jgi:hypothetical protein